MVISGRNEERLNQTFSKLEGDNHIMIPADLCNEDEISSLVEKLPKLDGLVLCAGLTRTQPVKNITKEADSKEEEAECWRFNSFYFFYICFLCRCG